MEKSDLEKVLFQFQDAVMRLSDALEYDVQENELYLDASIQRFEFCFELAWKTIKQFLLFQGIQTKTPRDSFKEAFKLGWLKLGDTLWSQMIEDRNSTSHTYNKDIAFNIYDKLPEYLSAYQNLVDELGSTLK